jgi:hypothetical protein
MPFVTIPSTDVDFKSPIDELLMTTIKNDLDFLNTELGGLGGGGGAVIQFKVNGRLNTLRSQILADVRSGYGIDGAYISSAQTFTRVRLYLKLNGTTGQTKIDIKRHVRVDHPIISIDYQMNFATQAVGRQATALNTQAISLATPTVNTQSIDRAQSTMNISEIISLGNSRWRANVEGGVLLDSDWAVNKRILIESASNAGNNGNFAIESVNQDGFPSIIFSNASGVQETSSPATVKLQLFEYIFTNPADTVNFVVGESFIAAGHTTGANNGTFVIVRVNDAGNNLVAYNDTVGATTQGGVAGTVQTTRWVYTFTAPVSTLDYFIGEKILAATHTSGVNNGVFLIVDINQAGNNLVVTNVAGVAQAGAAGTVNTNRWIYTVLTDPTLVTAIGERMGAFSHTSALNDGAFTIVDLKYLGLNNIVVYNEAGVTQAGVAGSVRSEKMILSFSADNSASYDITKSLVTTKNTNNVDNSRTYLDVVELNRGGGANFNIVVLNPKALTSVTSLAQAFAMGQVDTESRSVFTTLPTLAIGDQPKFGGLDGVFDVASVAANSMVSLDVLELPTGVPEDLSVDLS